LLTLEEHEPLPTTTQRHPNDTPTIPQRFPTIPNTPQNIPKRSPNDPIRRSSPRFPWRSEGDSQRDLRARGTSKAMRDVDAERQHRQLQEPSRADAGIELRAVQGRTGVVRCARVGEDRDAGTADVP